jgi:hypothetical protein
MSATSPAPWTVSATGGARTILAADRSTVAVIVESDGAAPFEVGNGQLLAAAPDLRDALRWAMTHIENVFALAGRHDRERPDLEKARAALAKSEGR